MDVGERLVDRLITHGVRRVFGVPGGQTAAFYHGLATRPGEIEHVLMRDERSAACAADAYARTSGRLGVCDATVGPGATNLVSGLAEAYASSIPVLAIIADIPRGWNHRRRMGSASQGFEQRDFLNPCVKWYARVEVAAQLDVMLAQAIRVAVSDRPGPVVLEIPHDVMLSQAADGDPAEDLDCVFPRTRTAPDPAAVERAVAVVRGARKPVLLAGGGAQISGAHDEVAAFARRLRVPVVTSISGKGIMSEDDPLVLGPVGGFGSEVVNELMLETDCVIAVGCKLGQSTTLSWKIPERDTAIVHLEIDAEEIGRNFPASTAVQGDAKLALAALDAALGADALDTDWDLEELARRVDGWWAQDVFRSPVEEDRIKPQTVVRALTPYIGDDDVVVTDASLSSGWMCTRWRIGRAGRRYLAPRGIAGLGWGLPAAVGAAFALRDAGSAGRVFCLAGDGAWAYSVSELEVLARFEVPLTSVVLNNATLAWNKHVVTGSFDKWVSQDFADVDWAKAAQAFGATGVRIDDTGDLDAALGAAARHPGGPSVVEVLTSEIETAWKTAPPARAKAADAAY